MLNDIGFPIALIAQCLGITRSSVVSHFINASFRKSLELIVP